MIVYYSYQLCLGVTVNRECLLQILILEFVVYFSSSKYHLIVLIQNIFYNSNFKAKIKKILKNKAKSQLNKDTNNENSLDEKNPNSKESAKQKRTIYIYCTCYFSSTYQDLCLFAGRVGQLHRLFLLIRACKSYK